MFIFSNKSKPKSHSNVMTAKPLHFSLAMLV